VGLGQSPSQPGRRWIYTSPVDTSDGHQDGLGDEPITINPDSVTTSDRQERSASCRESSG
ncbi:hypothetical protein KI387_029565, partial [Taxus chinensis]